MANLLNNPYAPSPTILRFLESTAPVKVLAGPVGGGKTVGSVIDLYLRALNVPADKDGLRKARIMIARATCKQATETALRSWMDWIPKTFLVSERYGNSPMLVYDIPLPNNERALIEVVVLGLDPHEAIAKLKSQEFTFGYINECNEVAWHVVQYVMSLDRFGRYPSKKDIKLPLDWVDENGLLLPKYGDARTGIVAPEWMEQLHACPNRGVVLDFNLTDTEHPLYKLCTAPPEGVEVFTQPPAMRCLNIQQVDEYDDKPILEMHPDAENVTYVPGGEDYYKFQLTAKPWPFFKRDVLMIWTGVEEGVRVHKEFRRAVHVKTDVEVVRGADTVIGFDTSGYNPAAVIGQIINGMVCVTDTLYEPDTSLSEFIDNMLLPLIQKKYYDCHVHASCDPSGNRGVNDLKPYALLQSKGIRASIAPTNNIDDRIAAVAKLFTRVDGCIIGSKEFMLIKGLESTYIFKKMKGGGLRPTPDKNCLEGHLCDALQYLALHVAVHKNPSRQRKPVKRPMSSWV